VSDGGEYKKSTRKTAGGPARCLLERKEGGRGSSGTKGGKYKSAKKKKEKDYEHRKTLARMGATRLRIFIRAGLGQSFFSTAAASYLIRLFIWLPVLRQKVSGFSLRNRCGNSMSDSTVAMVQVKRRKLEAANFSRVESENFAERASVSISAAGLVRAQGHAYRETEWAKPCRGAQSAGYCEADFEDDCGLDVALEPAVLRWCVPENYWVSSWNLDGGEAGEACRVEETVVCRAGER